MIKLSTCRTRTSSTPRSRHWNSLLVSPECGVQSQPVQDTCTHIRSRCVDMYRHVHACMHACMQACTHASLYPPNYLSIYPSIHLPKQATYNIQQAIQGQPLAVGLLKKQWHVPKQRPPALADLRGAESLRRLQRLPARRSVPTRGPHPVTQPPRAHGNLHVYARACVCREVGRRTER